MTWRADFTLDEAVAFYRGHGHADVGQHYRAYVFEDGVSARLHGSKQTRNFWTWCACRIDKAGNNIVERDYSVYSERDPTGFIRISQFDTYVSREDAGVGARKIIESRSNPNYLVEIVYDYPPQDVLDRMFKDEMVIHVNSKVMLERAQAMSSLLHTCLSSRHHGAIYDTKNSREMLEDYGRWQRVANLLQEIENDYEKRRG